MVHWRILVSCWGFRCRQWKMTCLQWKRLWLSTMSRWRFCRGIVFGFGGRSMSITCWMLFRPCRSFHWTSRLCYISCAGTIMSRCRRWPIVSTSVSPWWKRSWVSCWKNTLKNLHPCAVMAYVTFPRRWSAAAVLPNSCILIWRGWILGWRWRRLIQIIFPSWIMCRRQK